MIQISKNVVEKEKLGTKNNLNPEPTPQRSPTQTRYIPIKIKKELFNRANLQCEHIDKNSKLRCTSQFKLEIDHILPYSLGGSHQPENLQVLCRNHNANRTREL